MCQNHLRKEQGWSIIGETVRTISFDLWVGLKACMELLTSGSQKIINTGLEFRNNLSTKTFLWNIREPKFKKIKIWYQIWKHIIFYFTYLDPFLGPKIKLISKEIYKNICKGFFCDPLQPSCLPYIKWLNKLMNEPNVTWDKPGIRFGVDMFLSKSRLSLKPPG